MRVLLVEDEPLILSFLKETLENQKFNVKTANTLSGAKAIFQSGFFDLMVIDQSLPDDDFIDFVSSVQEKRKTPVLVLSGIKNQFEKAKRTGKVNNFLKKPCDPMEFLSKVYQIMRNSGQEILPEKIGSFKINNFESEILLGRQKLPLKTKEFKLLRYLLRNKNKLVSESEILENVWGDSQLLTRSNTVNVHVMRLRKILGQESKNLQTIRGKGFMFVLKRKKSA